jgi:hypothetical protein
MAYQGTADLAAMAEAISASVVNGQWKQAIDWLRQLNPLQVVYVMNEMIQYEYLTPVQMQRLALIAGTDMNDGETGQGWIADNQDEDGEDMPDSWNWYN